MTSQRDEALSGKPDPKREEVRRAIQKACPDILCDNRQQRQETLDFAYDDFLAICKDIAKEESSRTWVGAAIAFDRVRKLSGYAAMFQDRPITLEDVLRAVHKSDIWAIDLQGEFFRQSDSDGSPQYCEIKWTLGKSLDEQSDELISFLHSILV